MRYIGILIGVSLVLGIISVLGGCSGDGSPSIIDPPPSEVTVTGLPDTATMVAGSTRSFAVVVSGTSNQGVTWSPAASCSPSSGLSTTFTAPLTAGTYTLTATSVEDPTAKDTCQITVTANPPDPDVEVTIDPEFVMLETSDPQQFTATVTGTENTSVTWTTDGGTIDQNGFYRAPTEEGTFHVTVTSVADPSKSAMATVLVDDPVSVEVSPTDAEIEVCSTQQFCAEVRGDANTAVVWSVDYGTITPDGLYTAPSSVGNYHVTATSIADPTKSDTVIIRVVKTETVAVHVDINPVIAQIDLSDVLPNFIQFQAIVTGSVDTSVSWTTAEVYALDQCLLTPAGKFIVFKPGVFRIIAISNADASASAEATITVTE